MLAVAGRCKSLGSNRQEKRCMSIEPDSQERQRLGIEWYAMIWQKKSFAEQWAASGTGSLAWSAMQRNRRDSL